MADAAPADKVVQPTEQAPPAAAPALTTEAQPVEEKEEAPAPVPEAAPVDEKALDAVVPPNGDGVAPAKEDAKPVEEPKPVMVVEESNAAPAGPSAPVEPAKPAAESEPEKPAEAPAAEPVKSAEAPTSEPEQAAEVPAVEPEKPKEVAAPELDKPAEVPATEKSTEAPPEFEKATLELTAEPAKEESEKGSVLDKAKEVVKDAVQEVKDTVKSDKAEASNEVAAATEESQKDTEMLDASQTAPSEKQAPPNGTSQDVEMTDAPVPETQPTIESQAGDKRKLDEAGVNGSSTQEMPDASEPAEKRAKVAETTADETLATPVAAAPAANGAAPVSRKRSKKEKKPLAPVGKTQRRTRSQGLAEAP